MFRVRAALIVFVASALVVLGALAGAGAAVAQTTPPPASPTASPTTAAAVIAPPPAVAQTTIPPAGSRGGADEGSVVKPSDETWDVQRIVITTALVTIALAAAGYVYGKVRSTPPKHPDLTAQREDLERTG
jgi:hypothetical protein